MFFRLPVVRFFNRVINRATVTVALVLLQIGWLLWAFFSLTAGKVWVNAGLNVLSLFITLYLVRKDENSDYKIIWLVLIGMMPLLGGALYLAFGNKAPAKRMRQRMQEVERQHTADLAQQPGQTDALDPASRGLSRYISEYGPYPAWKNSTAKYYPCGEAMYPDLLADLEKAERFIFLEFFIVRTGKMWKGVEDILVRKAAQGVDVRLIYDDFGSLLGKCVILAPTTMLTPQGVRIKTDMRDAYMIAQCLSYGGYHAVYIPTEADDSVKEYLRMRNDHKLALKKIKQQINAFCIRHGFCYDGTKWTLAHLNWLKKLEITNELYRETLDEYMASYEEQEAKIERYDKRIEEIAEQTKYYDKVKKLKCFLGIKTHTALSLIVENGDFERFAKGNQYASYLGLAPGENSSSDSIHRLGITKAGNSHLG